MILSRSQIQRVASLLKNTDTNVFHLVKKLYFVNADEDLFDVLEEDFDLFKCDGCSKWLSCSWQSGQKPWLCSGCLSKQLEKKPQYPWEMRAVREASERREKLLEHRAYLEAKAQRSACAKRP